MPLTAHDIRRVARRTVDTLRDNGYSHCCLFGSAACSVWGMDNRIPNDIDVLVLTDDDPEDIKRMLFEEHDRFTLVDAANPRDTYKVLWYILCWRPRVECKVDIVVPGIMKIPRIRRSHISRPYTYDIPVMPFFPLLILKLQGWHDHCKDYRSRMRAKIPQDETDLDQLLDMLDDGDHLDNYRWLPDSFLQRARTFVREYVDEFPGTARSWRSIGFRV
ncbi:hypothetical protein AX17_005141 [Amanita inopinata Kibby_2008]|nr:hypothetical protein AX17_005141 [Amanita inopinata Kibby_2008]